MSNTQELISYIKNTYNNTDCALAQLVLLKAIELGIYYEKPTDDSHKSIIIDTVNKHFDADCSKRCRKRSYIRSRETVCYMLRKYTNLTLVEVSLLVGGIDHTTVIHHVKKVNQYIRFDISYRDEIEHLETIIKSRYESKQNNYI